MKEESIKILAYDYKPFGDSLSFGEDLPRQSFGSEERDEEMGYYQMGRRLYDPAVGRFMAVDPLFESFPTQSPYAYAFNSPLSWSDPSGLAPQKERRRDRVQNFDMNEYWIGYGLLQKAAARLEDERAGNYYEEMDYRQNMHFLAQSFSSRLGECGGGGGGGNKVENGITTIEFDVSDPNCPEDKKKFFVTYDKTKLAEGMTEEKIKGRITNAVSILLSTAEGCELLNTGDDVFHIDITKSGSELAEKGKECDWGAWVAGVSNFIYPEGCINTSGNQCRTDLIRNTIYIASEFFDNDPDNQGYIRASCAGDIPAELYFVISHELTHRWFSIPGNCNGSSNHEYSRSFCVDIWNILNKNCSFIQFWWKQK